MQDLLSRAQRTERELEASLRRKPSTGEVARAMGIEEDKLAEAYQFVTVGAFWGVGLWGPFLGRG
jgi:DNA-directed RNA polymerase sigma subunit (sigma70/sigma32)